MKLEDKTLTPAEQVRLREFVQEVFTTAWYDEEGVMNRLGEDAEVMAEILGFKLEQPWNTVDLDDDDSVPE